jgi:hypothetical protein
MSQHTAAHIPCAQRAAASAKNVIGLSGHPHGARRAGPRCRFALLHDTVCCGSYHLYVTRAGQAVVPEVKARMDLGYNRAASSELLPIACAGALPGL